MHSQTNQKAASLTLFAVLLFFACNPAPVEQLPSGNDNNKQDSGNTDPGKQDPSGNPGGSNPVVEQPDFSPEDWYQTYFWDRTDRQKAGIRGPVKSIHLSTPDYTNDRYNIYTFDEAGHLLKMEHKHIDTDEYNYSMTYTYDDAGRRIKMQYKDGQKQNGYTCEYGNGDRYVAVSYYDWVHMYGLYVGDGNGYANCQDLVGIMKGLSAVHFLTEEDFWYDKRDYEYVFDEDGNLTITLTQTYGQEKDNASTVVEKYHITYKDGLPFSSTIEKDGTIYPEVEQVQWQANGMVAKLVEAGGETYEYVANGRTVLIKEHSGYQEWGGMRGEVYYYDDNFDITGRDLDTGDEAYGIHHDSYTEYQYDKYGNWISRKEALTPIFWDGTEAGKSAHTVLQVIEYFGS